MRKINEIFVGRVALHTEILALRQQVAVLKRKRSRPTLRMRAPFLGAWMNFVLTFFAYDVMKAMMISTFGADGILTSPFWFAAEGAVVGLVIGCVATRFSGEGKETVGR